MNHGPTVSADILDRTKCLHWCFVEDQIPKTFWCGPKVAMDILDKSNYQKPFDICLGVKGIEQTSQCFGQHQM